MPEPGEQPSVASGPQLSLAVGSATVTGVPFGDVHSTVCGTGHEIDGAVSSSRARLTEQELPLWLGSDALQEAEVDPGAFRASNEAPQAAESEPLHVSVAVALTDVEAPHDPPTSLVRTVFEGAQVSEGGVVSTTVTVEVQVVSLCDVSVAVQVSTVVPSG